MHMCVCRFTGAVAPAAAAPAQACRRGPAGRPATGGRQGCNQLARRLPPRPPGRTGLCHGCGRYRAGCPCAPGRCSDLRIPEPSADLSGTAAPRGDAPPPPLSGPLSAPASSALFPRLGKESKGLNSWENFNLPLPPFSRGPARAIARPADFSARVWELGRPSVTRAPAPRPPPVAGAPAPEARRSQPSCSRP